MSVVNGILYAPDGAPIEYRIDGAEFLKTGPTVLFVHGIFSNSKDYHEVIRIVSRTYACVSFDLRGHGKSRVKRKYKHRRNGALRGGTIPASLLPKAGMTVEQQAEDLNCLIEHLSLTDLVLLGYSLGAFIVFEYVQNYGTDALKKIVIGDITPKMISDDNWYFGLYRGHFYRSDFERLINISDFKVLHKELSNFVYRTAMIYSPHRKHQSSPPLWARAASRVRVDHSPGFLQDVMYLLSDMCEKDYRDILPEFDIPTAFFYAEPGSLFMPATARYMADKITGPSELIEFKNTSHALLMIPPSRFARHLTDFIKE